MQSVNTSGAWHIAFALHQAPPPSRESILWRTAGVLGMEASKRKATKPKNQATKHYLKPIWRAMISRCTNVNNPNYFRYGGRGIKVCTRWVESFSAFVEDMGPRPEGMSIERIDNNCGYSPGNCRWATTKEQAINKRSTRWVEYDGKRMPISLWSKEVGIPQSTIHQRLKRMSVKEALTKPTTKPINRPRLFQSGIVRPIAVYPTQAVLKKG